MILTEEEELMLRGKYGPGVQTSIEFLVKLGEAFGAPRLVDVSSVHIHCAIPYDLLLEMTEGVERCRAPIITTHAHPYPHLLDPDVCEKIGLPYEYDTYEAIHNGSWIAIENEFRRLGFLLTYTCTPFYAGNLPKFGDVISWGGSSGVITCNSMFGACGGRDSVPVNLAAGITGKCPYMGTVVKEERFGEVLFRSADLKFEDFRDADYGALGYYIGEKAGSRNVVIEGLPKTITLDHFRHLVSAMPVSGAVTMCHVVGITPEARTLSEALGGRTPQTILPVAEEDIRRAVNKLTTADSDKVDLVKLGCPHCSLSELRNIASLLAGQKVHPNVILLIATSKQIYTIAKTSGYVDIIKKAGGVFTNTCVGSQDPFNTLGPELGIKTAATNSARAAHYSVRTSKGKVKMLYGSTRECLSAAISGKWRAV